VTKHITVQTNSVDKLLNCFVAQRLHIYLTIYPSAKILSAEVDSQEPASTGLCSRGSNFFVSRCKIKSAESNIFRAIYLPSNLQHCRLENSAA
jgi:hypothetical protein